MPQAFAFIGLILALAALYAILSVIYSLTIATIEFVVLYIAPALGSTIIAIVSFYIFIFTREYISPKITRAINSIASRAEEKRQKNIFKKDLERKIESTKELYSIKRAMEAHKLKSKYRKYIIDYEYECNIENLVNNFIYKLNSQKTRHINSMKEDNKKINTLISKSKKTTSKEKIKLYKDNFK